MNENSVFPSSWPPRHEKVLWDIQCKICEKRVKFPQAIMVGGFIFATSVTIRVSRQPVCSLHRSVPMAWSRGLATSTKPPKMGNWKPVEAGTFWESGSNSSGGSRFIVQRLRHPFIWLYRRGPRHFWNRRACLGYYPNPGPIFKMPCDSFSHWVGHATN